MRKPSDQVIDKIVAACGGNVRGALEVIVMLNENLESQIHQLYAALSIENREHCSLMRTRH